MNTKLILHSTALLTVIAAASLYAQVPAAEPTIPTPSAGAPPPALAVQAPGAELPAPAPDDPAAVPGLPGAGGPPPPPARVPVPPAPSAPRAENLPPPFPAGTYRFLHDAPAPGAPGAMPGAPPMKTPAPPVGAGYGSVGGPAELKPAKNYEHHLQNQMGPDKKPLTVVTKEKSVPRGEEIIRDTKLRVYQRHYETVLNEAIQARLMLLDAPPEKLEALKARQAALEEIARKLETDIRELSSPPRVSAMIAPGGGTVIVGGRPQDKGVQEIPGGAGGVLELHDREGNTLRLAPPPVQR